MISNLFSHHWFSWRTAVATLGLTGLLWYTVKMTRRFIARHGRDVVDAVFWTFDRVATRSISARISMRRYCVTQLADESSRYLHVPGLKGAALDVDTVFVPLTMELGGRDKSFSSSSFLDVGNRLVVIGDPGCGKSTLIKNVFRTACLKGQKRPPKEKLPLRLELKRLSPPATISNDSEAGEWIFEELRELVTGVEGFHMLDLFNSWSTDSGLLVLLDGLDEVAREQYQLVGAALRGLSTKLAGLSPANTIIVTMRSQFYQQVYSDLVESFPQTLYVRPFLPNEIYVFLTRWPFNIDRDKTVNRIYTTLADRPTLREMCSNPLILAMYVQHDHETGQDELPSTRTQFYEKVVNELLFIRRRRQQVGSTRFVSVRDQREAILGELAFENLSDSNQPSNLLPWESAIRVAQRIWKCPADEAAGRMRELASETGIITEERLGETLRFIHLTFCEFLAAAECARGRKGGWANLLQVHRKFVHSDEPQIQSRLVEVIPFAHALLPRADKTSALTDVAALGDRLVLGRCFLESQLYEQKEWEFYLASERDYLAGEGINGWNEDLLRRLHFFSVVLHDAGDWFEQVAHRPRQSELDVALKTIVGGGREAVVRVFTIYASQDASAALRLSEDVGLNMARDYPSLLVKSCQEPPVLGLIVQNYIDERTKVWLRILGEAALLYSNVAYSLDGMVFPRELLNRKKEKGITRWLRLGDVRPNSWYEFVCEQIAKTDGELELPAIFLLRTSYKNMRFYLRIIGTRTAEFMILAVAIVALSVSFSRSGTGFGYYFATAVAITANTIGFFFSVMRRNVKTVFSVTFNFNQASDAAKRVFSRRLNKLFWQISSPTLLDVAVELTRLREDGS